MADDRRTEGAATATRCPWCSSELATAGSPSCPTCGATLIEPDGSVPGVNAIDVEAISRAARAASPVRHSGLLSWISGEYVEDEEPAPPGSLAPPPPDVRREMLRLELQAEYASLQAEADAIVAEQEVGARASRAAVLQAGRSEAAAPPDAPAATHDTPNANSPD